MPPGTSSRRHTGGSVSHKTIEQRTTGWPGGMGTTRHYEPYVRQLPVPTSRRETPSRLLGHSSTRVTQDIYIHVNGDLYQRFYDATS